MIPVANQPFRVLVVDDEPINLQIAAVMLEKEGVQAAYALSGVEALDRVQAVDFDLFLVDIMMPGMDGIELCRLLQENPRTRDIPLIFLTAISRREVVVQAFEAGAVDFISKPFFGPELVQRVRAHLRIRDLQKRLEASVNETSLQILKSVEVEEELRSSQSQLAEANKVLENWAHRDPLTGLWNRRKAWDLMHYEADRSDRYGRPTGVIMIDLDLFKQVNDTYGHDVGDRMLVEVTGRLAELVRKQDILVRWGGEEFLVVLPETDQPGAEQLAEKMRSEIAGQRFEFAAEQLTLSLGIAVRMPGQDWDQVIKRADDALYLAKESGRNRAIAAAGL
ncbi:diguanylate cyclase [Spirochaeta africana]|uniref:diguanylate cyclase n=1 Tax=Spirochaeta africana (strain ATCC 700263 / DSM 8902 / Z-7692) TaxID=889378 RepID=H9ULM2_SPIAZ|nr:diguanylate cyclase [Spirochaeta africana]AFG38415.1 diguanylate cyclase (GGDEF) domain-containing protein [Spirochaeta africana DSM 8902]